MASCNVKVICRFRPVNERELSEGEGDKKVRIEFPDEASVNIGEESKGQNLFTLDRVFDFKAKQVIIFLAHKICQIFFLSCFFLPSFLLLTKKTKTQKKEGYIRIICKGQHKRRDRWF